MKNDDGIVNFQNSCQDTNKNFMRISKELEKALQYFNKKQLIRPSHPYMLSLTDENDEENIFYLDECIIDELYLLLRDYNKKTNPETNLPYIITGKTFSEKSVDELRELLNLNRRISYKDFLVISQAKTNECIKNNHDIKEIDVEIPIIYQDNVSEFKLIKAYYCDTCNLYYITSDDYENVSRYGVLLCQHMTWDEYIEYIKNTQSMYSSFSKYSLLRRMGYTVGIEANLSKQQRQAILSYVIENEFVDEKGNKWNKDFVIWFIEQQISKKEHNSYFYKAVSKWKEDLEFLGDYSFNHPVVHRIRNLIQ